MKVSIITATYNSQQTIQSCIESVLKQTYKNIELVIVDGNSSDDTMTYIKELAHKNSIINYSSEPDDGIYDALNKGIEMATGDIIGFVHSDDMLANEHVLDKIANTFNQVAIDGIYGDLHYVKPIAPFSKVRNWKSKPFQNKMLRHGWMPPHPTLFLKKEVYSRIGVFNIDYRIAADYDLVLRLFSDPNLKFHYMKETITKMRIGGASNKSFKNLIRKTREDLKAARTNGMPFPIYTIGMKNISKIPQWLFK